MDWGFKSSRYILLLNLSLSFLAEIGLYFSRYIDFYRDISFAAILNHEFCSAGLTVPKSQYQIGIFDNQNVSAKRRPAAIEFICRQKFRQFQIMGDGIVSCDGINAACAARHDLGGI